MPLLDHFSPRRSPRSSLPLSACQQINTLRDLGLVNAGLLDQPADQWPGSLSDRGVRMLAQSTRQCFKKPGIAPRSVFSRPRTPNYTLRAGIDGLSGTIKSQPVYPGYFAGVPTAVTYFAGF